MTPELARTVEAAYVAFKCLPPEDLGVCHRCCMEEWIEDDFLNHNPRDLRANYISDWYFAAVTAAGGVVAHKGISEFVMPRVLELLAEGKDPATVGEEVVLERLGAGLTDRWSKTQNATLEDFKCAYLDSLINDKGRMLDDVLCMFVNAGFDPTSLTDRLLGWNPRDLIEILHKDWVRWGKPSIWRTAFWDEKTMQAKQVMEWYHSNQLRNHITEYAAQHSDDAELSSKANAILRLI
ncbi:hypothetical protein [Amylibacter sp. IMCC11727]|uniref:hypothetical protein n=1 Tax=Amylibacter sp. IMCC11727 TaxID=3039851 RepID=UPI00244DA0A4|nr:hypothetical protein [Amylibacter sp. IMCC11727]WGI22381.1 hypothetical protein QBD29_02895 [Amylibacter sp. IMCC11727]